MSDPTIYQWVVVSYSDNVKYFVGKGLRQVDGTLPTSRFSINTKSDATITIQAKKINPNDLGIEKEAYDNCKVNQLTRTYMLHDGGSVTGFPVGWSQVDIEGELYKNVSITLLILS